MEAEKWKGDRCYLLTQKNTGHGRTAPLPLSKAKEHLPASSPAPTSANIVPEYNINCHLFLLSSPVLDLSLPLFLIKVVKEARLHDYRQILGQNSLCNDTTCLYGPVNFKVYCKSWLKCQKERGHKDILSL